MRRWPHSLRNRIRFFRLLGCAITVLCTLDAWAATAPWSVHLGDLQDLSPSTIAQVEFKEATPSTFQGFAGTVFWFRADIDIPDGTEGVPLGVYIGRINDADRTFWDGQLIGQTGFDTSEGEFRPHIARAYFIPRGAPGRHQLLIQVKKLYMPILGFGPVTDGPVVAPLRDVRRMAFFSNFIRSGLPLLMGFAILLFGFYHLYLWRYLPRRRDYLWFGLTLISFSVYAICFSFFPYEVIESPLLVWRMHMFGAFFGLWLFSRWFIQVDRGFFGRFPTVLLVLTLLFFCAGLLARTVNGGVEVFMAWHPLLFASLAVYTAYAIKRAREGIAFKWGNAVAVVVFYAALIYDTLVSRQVIRGEQWAIPAFIFVLILATFVLGRDFAHAFLDVEKTVDLRTADLARANEELRALEEMKARFFANVSHDLKTPIAIAFANLEETRKAVSGPGAVALEAAERALNKLEGMVVDLLDTIRGDSDALKLRWVTVAPGPLARSWCGPYVALCEQKGLLFDVSIEVPDALKVPMDVSRMERVFANLVSNAIKFTDRGMIRVCVRSDASKLFIEVVDTGPGIPVNEREKIFDRFYQGFNTTLRSHGGSGIGLSFVHEVVSAHNGRIWVEDGNEGGSKFIVGLPISQDVELTGEHKVGDSDERVLPLKGSLDVPYPESMPAVVDAKKPTVLLVEDNPEIAQVVYTALSEQHNVYFARHGAHALELLQAASVECILSDIMMPEMDGTEFLKNLRKIPHLRTVPVIMLSSRGEDEDVIEHLRLGAQDYVLKPFHRDVLLARVRAQVETHRLRSRLIASDKLVTLGLLSSGISHEIKNPLMAALSNLGGLEKILEKVPELASKDAQLSDDAKAYLSKKAETVKAAVGGAIRAVTQIQRISDSMKGYSTGSALRSEIRIDEAVEEAKTIVDGKRKAKQISEIEHQQSGDTKVLGYAAINQALVNLLDNAIDAVEAGTGKISVETSAQGDRVFIAVTDNGSGISPEILTRVFDPFMTTKPPGKGTGLGLYITRDIVEVQHGGRLSVQSMVGQGTTFRIEIPREAPEMTADGAVSFHGQEMQVV